MLSDRYFYPLALGVIGVIIYGALSFGTDARLSKADIMRQGWTLSGADLQSLTVSPGSELVFDPEGNFVTLSQYSAYGDGTPSVGVFATLGPDYEQAFAGQTLRIVVRARASGTDPLKSLHTAYYPMEANSSRWREFTLSPDWENHTFFFKAPVTTAEPNVDLMAIFPGWAGEQKKMDLAMIRISVEPDTPSAPSQ